MMTCLFFVYIWNNNQLFVYSHINIIQNLIKKRIYQKTITNFNSLRDTIQITMASAWCVKIFFLYFFFVKSTVCLHFGRSWNFQILNLVKVFKLGLGHPHPQGPWKVRLLKIDLTSVSLLLYWNYLGGSILIVQK